MIRLVLVAVTASALAACAASPGPDQVSLAKNQRACAAVGVAPGSGRFSRCVTDLNQTLSDDASNPG
jgi:hypothetical protein